MTSWTVSYRIDVDENSSRYSMEQYVVQAETALAALEKATKARPGTIGIVHSVEIERSELIVVPD